MFKLLFCFLKQSEILPAIQKKKSCPLTPERMQSCALLNSKGRQSQVVVYNLNEFSLWESRCLKREFSLQSFTLEGLSYFFHHN